MQYVVIATHSAEVCPLSNSKTKALMLEMAPQIPKIAEQTSVKIVAGPLVNREHMVVTVVEAGTSEDLDRFLRESRLEQWNAIHILPSLSMEQGMTELQSSTPIF
jgi:hypothetical protein